MIKAKCLSKNRNNKGIIINYTLIDLTGHKINVTTDQIKNAMKSGQLQVVNLQLDSLGRLVDKTEEKINKNSVLFLQKSV